MVTSVTLTEPGSPNKQSTTAGLFFLVDNLHLKKVSSLASIVTSLNSWHSLKLETHLDYSMTSAFPSCYMFYLSAFVLYVTHLTYQLLLHTNEFLCSQQISFQFYIKQLLSFLKCFFLMPLSSFY